jgi:hypothetical protein
MDPNMFGPVWGFHGTVDFLSIVELKMVQSAAIGLVFKFKF